MSDAWKAEARAMLARGVPMAQVRLVFERYVSAGLGGEPSAIVEAHKARSTGTLVVLYRAREGGIESDPATPWATVCEPHGGVVCHETRAQARAWMSEPENWCPTCQEERDRTA